jgi:hypothetical protein
MDKKLEEMIPAPVEVERSIKNVVENERVKFEEKGKDGINLQFNRHCLAN